MSNGGRRAELDGVRGIAILLVLVGHASDRLEPLAVAGVSLFFTLSGYLITGLLLAEREKHGRLDLRRFYARRFTRLAPPLFVMLAVMGLLLDATWLQLAGPATWLTNYAAITGVAVPEAFGHTWSLAVEEQFYLLWPLALLLLLRRRNPSRTLLLTIGALVVWWVALRSAGHFTYAYLALETAAIPVLGGCLAALRGDRPQRFGSGVTLASIIAVSGSLAAVNGAVSWSSVPVLAAPFAMMAVAAARESAWLAWRPLAFCGVASYSLYLWHLPVAWLVGGGEFTALGIFAGALVGVVAWAAIERPLMAWRSADRRPAPIGRLHGPVLDDPLAARHAEAV